MVKRRRDANGSGALGNIALLSDGAVEMRHAIRDRISAHVEKARPRLPHEHLEDEDDGQHVHYHAQRQNQYALNILCVKQALQTHFELLVGSNEN